MSFNGDDVVRVRASPSIDLGSAMTLSAWVRPSVSQGGWRTIVHRETDVYFLVASSVVAGDVSVLDDIVAAGVAAAGIWFCAGAFRNGGWWNRRRWSWQVAVVAFVVGCLLDAAFAPSATVFGPMLVAVWFAVTARRRGEAIIGWTVAGACGALTVVSLTDLGDAAVWMMRDDGGNLRSATLGGVLVVCGLVGLRSSRGDRPTSGLSMSANRRSGLARGLHPTKIVVDKSRIEQGADAFEPLMRLTLKRIEGQPMSLITLDELIDPLGHRPLGLEFGDLCGDEVTGHAVVPGVRTGT